MVEQWKAIEGYEDIYEVSDQGRVKSLKFDKERILRTALNTKGYLQAHLFHNGERKTFLVHRLVAEACIPNPESDERLEINHRNGDKTDNRVANLEWCTHSENVHHSRDVLGKTPRGESHGRSKLTEAEVRLMRKLYKVHGITQQILAARFRVSQMDVGFIVRRVTWQHVEEVA